MEFVRHFEGRGVLEELLALAGSPLPVDEVLARFVAAHQEGHSAGEVIPTLFEGEPRFENPELARRLYQNLLGLWDLASSGRTLEEPSRRPPREKKEKPKPPAPFGAEGPDAAWVGQAIGYLDRAQAEDPRALERLQHAFENRHDAVLQSLEEAGLSDEAYATARYLLFELFAMISLGTEGAARKTAEPPLALEKYIDEALLEAAEDAPSAELAAETARIRSVVELGLRALWRS